MTETKDPGVRVEGSTVTITDTELFHENVEKMKAKHKTVRENYDFKYEFSEEEKAQKAQQLARACKDRTTIEDEKKSVMANFKAKIDSASAEVNLLSNQISNGYEYLTKTCDVVKDFDKGVKIYYYEGVQVGTEKLKPSDYQVVIDYVENQPEDTEEEENSDIL